jgi:polyisoprenoid-binding protein YceI
VHGANDRSYLCLKTGPGVLLAVAAIPVQAQKHELGLNGRHVTVPRAGSTTSPPPDISCYASGSCSEDDVSRQILALLPSFVCLLGGATMEQRLSPAEGNRFEVIVEKTGLMKGKKHLFVFERYQGKLHHDSEKPEASQVQFSLESNSIACKDDWVSAKDLKKIMQAALKDMLAADRYATVSYKSNGVRRAGPNQFDVTGTLRIRNVEKPATVRVTLKPGEAGRTHFEGNAVVRMTDFGLKPPSAALGLIGTKDEMTVSFHLRAE